MVQTTRLQLPLISAAQAQKHVTHNEAILRLDGLCQMQALSYTVSAQPASPADGDLYLLPAGKTGSAWGGAANHAAAHYYDGVWHFYAPRAGWIAFIADTSRLVYHNGTQWTDVLTPSGASAADGSASAPGFAFASDTDTGLYRVGANSLGITAGGTLRKTIDTAAETNALPTLGPDGSASAPAMSFSGDTNTGLYRIGADILGFAAGGAEKLRLSASGLSFDGGTSFYKPGAVQDFATAPVLKFGGGNTGMTYSVQVGKYVQIGPAVLFFVRINLSAKGSSTGAATVENLPLAAANASNGYHFNTVSFTNANSSGNASGANQQGAYIAPNSTTITLICTKNGSDTALTDADFTSTTWINVHGFYFV